MQPDLEDFAERLVAGMSEAIIYADADGAIRFWNGGAARVFGFTEVEALGRSLDIIVPEGLRSRHWHGYRATMRTGQSRYGDGELLSVPAVRKDGVRISVEFTLVPFTDDTGKMIGIAAIMRDATSRFDELRALRKKLAARPAPANPSSGTTRSRRVRREAIGPAIGSPRRLVKSSPDAGLSGGFVVAASAWSVNLIKVVFAFP